MQYILPNQQPSRSHRNFFGFMLVAILLAFFVQSVLPIFAQADRIAQIIVTGNKKTKSSVIISVSRLKEDQEITDQILQNAEDRVSGQGLFDEVDVTRRNSSRKAYVIIEIRVKEKISWFAVPYLSYSDDNFSLGGAVGETNFLGRLKKIVLFADWGPNTKRALVAYRDPRFVGTKFTLSTDVVFRKTNMREYADRREIRDVEVTEWGFTLMPGYKWSDHFGVELGPFFRNVSHLKKDPRSGTDEDQALRTIDVRDGKDLSLMLNINYDDRKFKHGFSAGSRVSLETQVSDNRFGSKFDYYRQKLYLHQSYYLWPKYLNMKHDLTVHLGLTLPFYRELMIGGSNLRGYVENQFRGDTRYSLSNEAWFPLFDIQMVVARGIAFWDSGILYFKDTRDGFKRERWNNGIGGGVRFYVRGINIPVLGYDMAYGIEDKSYGGYLKIGAAF